MDFITKNALRILVAFVLGIIAFAIFKSTKDEEAGQQRAREMADQLRKSFQEQREQQHKK